jgi:hypothetical protein
MLMIQSTLEDALGFKFRLVPLRTGLELAIAELASPF